MPSVEPPDLDRPNYLKGEDREKYAAYVHHLYTEDEMTMREIVRLTNRGFGTIHDLLREHGTRMRSVGRPMGYSPGPQGPRHTSNRRHPEGHEELTEVLDGVVEERRDGEWRTIE